MNPLTDSAEPVWPSVDRWRQLCDRLGGSEMEIVDQWYRRLSAAYVEPHRHYHNQRHIAECLREFDAARELIDDPDSVEMAIWFHDAVYDPLASDNEERSAQMARLFLKAMGCDEKGPTIEALILSTKAHVANSPDGLVLLNIDLSILGQPAPRFAEYEAAIRKEYQVIPDVLYRSKRAEILRHFVAREEIYGTPWFADRYEEAARRNLMESLRQLSGGTAENER